MAKKKQRPRVLVMGGGLVEQLEKAGAESVYIGSSDKNAIEAAGHDNIHALILTGGVDVSPSLYGQKPHRLTQSPWKQRDEVEIRALNAAYHRGIPVLGICRGSQLINVAFGGTLHQHIRDVGAHKFHLGHDHRVDLVRGSRLREILGVEAPWVVSIHHQAVNRVAKGFRVAAKSRDGIIEAIETRPGSGLPWIIGTQFHPEIETSPVEQGLFNALVRESARMFKMPEPTPIRHRSKPAPALPVPTAKALPALFPNYTGESPIDGPGWVCFRCSITFDSRTDHVDHMFFLHDVDLVPLMPLDAVLRYIDEAAGTEDEARAIEERWLAKV